MPFDWLNGDVKSAVKHFWSKRDGGAGVLSGKTLDPFLDIIEKVIKNSGLPNAQVFTSKTESQLPGYFRPHKAWDIVVINEGKLIAVCELKSQVGSIGNNFNNRSEEVLGSSFDLQTAIQEDAFEDNPDIFTGYLILVEDSEKTKATPSIRMKYFPVMKGFLLDEKTRGKSYKMTDGKFPSATGISYMDRYDFLCKRLMIKKLYTATALIPIDPSNIGNYRSISPETSHESFFTKLSSHCRLIESYGKQEKKLDQ
jgi:hypothetical protein